MTINGCYESSHALSTVSTSQFKDFRSLKKLVLRNSVQILFNFKQYQVGFLPVNGACFACTERLPLFTVAVIKPGNFWCCTNSTAQNRGLYFSSQKIEVIYFGDWTEDERPFTSTRKATSDRVSISESTHSGNRRLTNVGRNYQQSSLKPSQLL